MYLKTFLVKSGHFLQASEYINPLMNLISIEDLDVIDLCYGLPHAHSKRLPIYGLFFLWLLTMQTEFLLKIDKILEDIFSEKCQETQAHWNEC